MLNTGPARSDFEEDFGGPPFTQKKRTCHIVLSDDDDTSPKVGMTVMQDVQPVVGDRESLPADSKPAVGNEQHAVVSHSTPGGEKMKNRPKAGDYDPATRQILETAIEFYHALLLSENPFPESHVKKDWAIGAWDMSCQYYKSMDVNLDPALMWLVRAFLCYVPMSNYLLDHFTKLEPLWTVQNKSTLHRCHIVWL